MVDYVTDTHGLIWHLQNTLQQGTAASRIFDECERGLAVVYVPTISLVEIVYLQEKGRIPAQLKALFDAKFQTGKTGLKLAPLTAAIVESLAQIPRVDIPEMPDRIIAATALHLGLPLLSRDHKIRASIVTTIWK